MGSLLTVAAGAADALHAAFTITGKTLCGESCARAAFTTSLDTWNEAASTGKACEACDREHLRRMGAVRYGGR